MDKYELRRLALRDLIDSMGYGAIADVAGKVGKQPSYVSRMLYPPEKKGGKRIGEDSWEAIRAAYPHIDTLNTPHLGAAPPPSTRPEESGLSPEALSLARLYERATPEQRSSLDALAALYRRGK